MNRLTNKKTRRNEKTGARPIRNLFLALGLISLGACANRTTHWSPVESPKKNQVSWAEFHHPVNFTGTSAAMDKAEKEALARFLARVGRGEGVKVMLATGSTDPSALIKRRETGLARHLIEGGFSVSRIQAHRSDGARSNSVRVTVGRYIVKSPTCPDWSKDSTGDPFNRVSSNFRCATETNLGLMVADPGVLIRGTDVGPADGEAVALGVKAYRTGKTEGFSATSAKALQGGGGGK